MVVLCSVALSGFFSLPALHLSALCVQQFYDGVQILSWAVVSFDPSVRSHEVAGRLSERAAEMGMVRDSH